MAATETYLTLQDGWTFRIQPPQGSSPAPLLVLLHGWTGDENVMWIFARRLPRRYWMVAPRAPLPAPGGGYGWLASGQGIHASIHDFSPAVEGLIQRLDHWAAQNHVDAVQFSLVGFSQGAALAYALTLLHPGRVRALAALAGFLPDGWNELPSRPALAGKPVYITHGTLDTTIPVGEARQAAEVLESLGSRITYCEDEVGHKLSAGCLHGLETFFSALS